MFTWLVKYFTHPRSYCPSVVHETNLWDVAKLTLLTTVHTSPRDWTFMRQWAEEHCHCVSQITVRQLNTKTSQAPFPWTSMHTCCPASHSITWMWSSDDPEVDLDLVDDMHDTDSSSNEEVDAQGIARPKCASHHVRNLQKSVWVVNQTSG